MLWAVVLQILAVAVGWQVVRQLPVTWRRLEALAASVAVGFALCAWVFFAGAVTVGWNLTVTVMPSLLLLAMALSWWRLPRRCHVTSLPYTHSRLGMVLGWLVAVPVAGWLMWLTVVSYQFPGTDGVWYANGNVWGDAPLHVSLTNQFSLGDKLDLISPVYKQVALTYPIMSDLWSAVSRRLGGNWTVSLMVPSAIMLLALLQLMFSFAYRLLGSARAAFLSWLMIVFSGSTTSGWRVGKVLVTQGYEAFLTEIRHIGDNYLNFMYSHPLPQRAYLFGMPLFIVVMTVALELWRQRKQRAVRTRQVGAVVAGVVLGLMPLVHTHSFMVSVGGLALATGIMWWSRYRVPAGWWLMIGTGLAVALPQIIWQFSTTYHSGFSHWIWGWKMADFYPDPTANWWAFWLVNTGWLFVVLVGGWFWLRRIRAKAELWVVYLAATGIFAVCNVYVFQPSMWDNMKFFEYAFWLVMIVAAGIMAPWLRTWWGRLAVGGLMLSLTAMGFCLLVLAAPRQTYELLSADEVRFGQHMQASLPTDAYVLVGDRHNHPITMLADRKVLMTFAGWYNLYDGNWIQTYTDRGIMLRGESGAQELIAHYGLGFAAFSDAEIWSNQVNQQFFTDHYTLFANEGGWWVYDLRQAASR
jgi:hypothetical protein